jgi:tripartite-type tricarboxylate transporter receptor subunit TctC
MFIRQCRKFDGCVATGIMQGVNHNYLFYTVFLISASVVSLTFASAHAAYPERPVRVIIPFPPGGGTDLVGRIIAGVLTERLGVSFVSDNRVGAGGAIGAEIAAKAAPDGYTLLVGTPGSMTINPAMMLDIAYEPLRDFEPITRATFSHMVLVVRKELPVKSVKDVIALAKVKGSVVTIGSSGIGSTSHLGGELFKMMAGVQMTNVPYKGTGPAVIDLVGGRIDVMIENLPALSPFIKRGDIRLLAVGGSSRAPGVPDVPTIAEAGLPGYESTTWLGLFAPAKTPRPIINKLHATVASAMRTPAMKEKLAGMGYESTADDTPEQLRVYLAAKLTEMKTVVKTVGLKPQ